MKLFLTLIVLPLIAILLVNPGGEFPLNDDWSYALSVRHFVETGRLQLSSWPAMSLIWQVIYSGLICKLIGFSFLHLREITLAIAVLNNIVFYALFRRVGVRSPLALLATLAIFFNPVYFNLAFTFMTEVHFLFWFGLSLLCIAQQKLRWVFVASIFASLAFLIRQHGLLVPAAFVTAQAWLVLCKKKTARDGAAAVMAMTILPFITYAVFQYWYIGIHGSTPSYARKLDLLTELNWQQVTLNLWGSVSYLAWFLLPVTLVVAAKLWNRRYWIPAVVLAVAIIAWHMVIPTPETALASVEVSYRNQMPYLLNIVHNFGLGPITLKDIYRDNVLAPNPLPIAFWWGVTALVGVGTILMLILVTRRIRNGGLKNQMALFSFFLLGGLILLEILISPEKDGGLFDRHLLIYILPATILLLPSSDPNTVTPSRTTWGLGLVTLSLFSFYSIAGTHDYLAWNRARWEGLHYLMTDLKIPPDQIDGGFEFNGWLTSDTFPPQGNSFRYKRNSWWVAQDRYKVFWKMTPMYEDSFTVIRTIPYTSWLRFGTHSITIARRNDLD